MKSKAIQLTIGIEQAEQASKAKDQNRLHVEGRLSVEQRKSIRRNSLSQHTGKTSV